MRVVFSEDRIRRRVRALAQKISRDYKKETVHVVGIMDSGFVFLSDLVRRMTCPVVCHFLRPETKDTVEARQPSSDIVFRNIVYGPLDNMAGRNILLVNALVESGITVDHLVQQLWLKKPKSLRSAALLDREDRRRVSFHVDYVGFPWSGSHVVGYGLGEDGLYRNLPYIASIRSPAASSRNSKGKQTAGSRRRKGGTVRS